MRSGLINESNTTRMSAIIRFNFQPPLNGYRGVLKWGLIILFLFPMEFLSAQPFEVIVNLFGIESVSKGNLRS